MREPPRARRRTDHVAEGLTRARLCALGGPDVAGQVLMEDRNVLTVDENDVLEWADEEARQTVIIRDFLSHRNHDALEVHEETSD